MSRKTGWIGLALAALWLGLSSECSAAVHLGRLTIRTGSGHSGNLPKGIQPDTKKAELYNLSAEFVQKWRRPAERDSLSGYASTVIQEDLHQLLECTAQVSGISEARLRELEAIDVRTQLATAMPELDNLGLEIVTSVVRYEARGSRGLKSVVRNIYRRMENGVNQPRSAP